MEERQALLLAASHACGPNSARLAAWLLAAGSIDHRCFNDAGVCERARIGPDLLARYRHARERGAPPLEAGWQLVTILDEAYPSLLRTLPDPPGLLFVKGDPGLLSEPQIAIVGARGASPEGRDTARRFAGRLAAAGFVITSGLALGIDAAAHGGALEAGRTLAVLGHGPGPAYPPRNRPLADDIVSAAGALVTEFPPGRTPRREHFPARNRVIAGLTLATVVVEAAPQSGSLITARLAAQLGREVFAVPGSIHNPLSKGCHQLLRDGANWLESVDDILAHFGAFDHLARAADAAAPAPLLEHFLSGVNTLDQLATRSGLTIAALSEQLLELELAGLVERIPGGYGRRLA